MLGNILPSLQQSVIDQLEGDNFIVTDTMNLWIETMHPPPAGGDLCPQFDALWHNDQKSTKMFNTFYLHI